jgi:uncharacterized protein (DUF2164 family)
VRVRGKPDVTIPPEARKQAVASIRRYLKEEWDQEIGDLKAGLLLDYVLQELGPTVYNQAIADARRFFEERAADLDSVCYRAEFPFWNRKPRDG